MGLELSPWLWGLAGAFIYGGQRWQIALSATDDRGGVMMCTLEFIIVMAVGAISAAAFGKVGNHLALTTLHLEAENAVCAAIGLLANAVAPKFVKSVSEGADLVGRVLKALKGEEK